MRGGTPVEGKEIVAWVAQPEQVAQRRVVRRLTVADVVNLVSCNKELWKRRDKLLPPMLALAEDGGLQVARNVLFPNKYKAALCARVSKDTNAAVAASAFIDFVDQGHLDYAKALAKGVRIPRDAVIDALAEAASNGNLAAMQWITEQFDIKRDEIVQGNRMGGIFELASVFSHRGIGKWLVHKFRLRAEDVQPHIDLIDDASMTDGDYSYQRWLKRRLPGLEIPSLEEVGEE